MSQLFKFLKGGKMTVTHFTKDNFEKEVLKSDKPVVVDFFAEWCGPCKMLAPVIEELAQAFEGKAVVGKVDVGKEQQLAQKFGVMSIPTVILFKDGQAVDKQIGFAGKEHYQKMIEKQL